MAEMIMWMQYVVQLQTAIQLVWLNPFTGSQSSYYPQKLRNKNDIYLRISK